ncbi:MAG: AAA family ATPase [Desulfatitalea sp.]|nr:AAA family ATPase [Desulfatitalea sp.]NNK01201.1 AAA family ATPase [Desulfatitalea sp.]
MECVDSGQIIVVGGKGGVGKTSVSAMIVKLLSQKNQRLLVIDADPVISLTHALGETPVETIGNYREKVIHSDEEKRTLLKRPMKTIIREMMMHNDGRFDLLTMGRAEAKGCFCGTNELLRHGIESLCGEYDTTLIDCEAGIEQVNRRVVHHIDSLLLLTDTSRTGMLTLTQLKDIAVQCNEGRPISVNVLVNRLRHQAEEDGVNQMATDFGLTVIGAIPEDPSVREFNHAGRPLLMLPDDSPAVAALQTILAKVGLL